MSEHTNQPGREVIRDARIGAVKDDDPCTVVFADVAGAARTVVISNEAIAQCLQLREGRKLMVEECSDFVSTHQSEIATAAAKSLARRGTVEGRVLLVAGDL